MKEGINVLLVYPNPMMDNLIPVGISVLSACLKEVGHKVRLFDTTFYESGKIIGDKYREKNLQIIKTDLKSFGVKRVKKDVVKDFKKVVEEYKPKLIAVSSIEIGYSQALELLRSVKNIPKLIGGIHVTFSPEEVIKEDCVDIICVGEGEDAIVELANNIRDGKDITNIQNLWVKKDGNLICNKLRSVKDLSTLPFQDWEIYDKKRLYKPFSGKISVTAGIETMRGCYGRCSYCCNPVSQRIYNGKFFRLKSINRVIDEVEYLKEKYDIGFIKFVDADFLVRKGEDIEKFVKLFKKFKIGFWVNVGFKTITEKKLKLLEEAGCSGFAIGIESGNEYIRNKVLKKDVSNEEIIKVFKIINKSKLKCCANIMIGLPYESRKEIFDTINLCRKLNLKNPIVNIFNPYSGTELRELCVQEGYIPRDVLAGDYRGEYIMDMPQITRGELLGLQRTFPLYLKFPKSRWSLIKLAEGDDITFNQLSKEYTKRYLRGG